MQFFTYFFSTAQNHIYLIYRKLTNYHTYFFYTSRRFALAYIKKKQYLCARIDFLKKGQLDGF